MTTNSQLPIIKSEETQNQRLKIFSSSEIVSTKWPRLDRLILKATLEVDNPETYAGDFTFAVAKICQQLGCKLPSQELFSVLFEFHCKYFSKFTIAEIKTAFELHLLGEITDDKGERFKHYQNFDCDFYSSILLKYQQRKDRVIVNAKTELSKIDYEERNVRDNVAAHQNILNQIREDFDLEEPQIFSIKYDILIESGVLTLSTEEKKKFMEQAEIEIKNDAFKRGELREMKDITIGLLSGDVKAVAKRLAYKHFLSNRTNLELLNQS